MIRSAATTSGPPVSAGGCAMATARYTSMIVLPGERGLARQHLEQDRADREQVGGGDERLALPLLRRHVARRPDDRARRGERRRRS